MHYLSGQLFVEKLFLLPKDKYLSLTECFWRPNKSVDKISMDRLPTAVPELKFHVIVI